MALPILQKTKLRWALSGTSKKSSNNIAIALYITEIETLDNLLCQKLNKNFISN